MEVDIPDKIEMYVLIFGRNITLEYLKASEITLKPPVGLLCLLSFIRTEFSIAKSVCHCRLRRDQHSLKQK